METLKGLCLSNFFDSDFKKKLNTYKKHGELVEW